jgi:hypothetical protein
MKKTAANFCSRFLFTFLFTFLFALLFLFLFTFVDFWASRRAYFVRPPSGKSQHGATPLQPLAHLPFGQISLRRVRFYPSRLRHVEKEKCAQILQILQIL